MHTDVEHGEEQGETAVTENNFGGGKRGRALITAYGAASPPPAAAWVRRYVRYLRLRRAALRGAARGRGAEPLADPPRRSSMLPSPRV